ncbi:uncharacterized protein LOC112456243, partial [Temnothorax curvispinosus]|uniref:Uncharacterized protein LOC112456243 n=1 Tax=Temnothorax curvispinosus TaxID=300111 RepID=A0A6J1Q0C1_9HYME
ARPPPNTMDFTGEEPPKRQKRRYKRFLDPAYQEHDVSAKTHDLWVKRSASRQMNTTNSPSGSIENPEEASESNVADNDDTSLESGSLVNATSSDRDDMDVDVGLHDSRSISNASESSSISDGENNVDTSEESEDEDILHDRNNCDDDPIMFEVSQLKESEVMEMITGICGLIRLMKGY